MGMLVILTNGNLVFKLQGRPFFLSCFSWEIVLVRELLNSFTEQDIPAPIFNILKQYLKVQKQSETCVISAKKS